MVLDGQEDIVAARKVDALRFHRFVSGAVVILSRLRQESRRLFHSK